jgi:hypothetical protein
MKDDEFDFSFDDENDKNIYNKESKWKKYPFKTLIEDCSFLNNKNGKYDKNKKEDYEVIENLN